jgi:hypothetical protein
MSDIMEQDARSNYKEQKTSMNREDYIVSRKSIGSLSNDFRKSISIISDHHDCR